MSQVADSTRKGKGMNVNYFRHPRENGDPVAQNSMLKLDSRFRGKDGSFIVIAMNDFFPLICGIDEVGRGPWAGPVVAAAVILPDVLPDFFTAVTDSKKLSATQRDKLFPMLIGSCQVGLGQASVEEIDRLNILQATFLAMQRAFEALPVKPHKALVDGNKTPKLPCLAEAVIGGDAKVPAIAAASIIAKVTRDRLMIQLDQEFPGYGWASNAGYGAPAHQAGLASLGVTPHHRRSFAPIKALIQKVA